MNFRTLFHHARIAAALACIGLAPAPWAPAATLTAPANDNIADFADVNALLGGAVTGAVTFDVNPAGSTGEAGEEIGKPDPLFGGTYQGSLWVKVRSPYRGGITLDFVSFLRNNPDNPPYQGFVPYLNVHNIDAGSVPSLPLASAIGEVSSFVRYQDGREFAFAAAELANRPESDYVIRLQAPSRNLAGFFTVTVHPDLEPPTLSIDSAVPTSGPVAADSATFAFNGRVTEGHPGLIPTIPVSGLARVEYRVDSGSVSSASFTSSIDSTGYYTTGTFSASVAVAPGAHVFEARSVDGAGNVSPWRAVTFVRTTPPPAEPRDAEVRDAQSFGVDDAGFTGWIAGTYYVDQALLDYDGTVFGPGRRAYVLNSRGWPINIVYDLAGGAVTGLLSLPAR